jgi:vesicle coat complex subunit
MMLILAAASKFIELAVKESDNNVKLIVLDKVNELHQKHEGVLEDLVMEVLRVLSRYFILPSLLMTVLILMSVIKRWRSL